MAEYRFGSGSEGILADADRAMYSAKQFAKADGKSHVAYRHEISEVAGGTEERIAATA